jgi:magnesium chelatase subunit D
VLLLFSDGCPNVSCFGQDPLQETFFYAEEIKRHSIQSILVDTELNLMGMGCGFEIARRMQATYLPMDRLYDRSFP